jgi:hypothetical protein
VADQPRKEMTQGFYFAFPIYDWEVALFVVAAVALVVWLVKRKKQ